MKAFAPGQAPAMAFVLTSVVIGVGIDTFIKQVTQDMSLLTVMTGRYLVGAAIAIVVFGASLKAGGNRLRDRLPDRRGFFFHAVRGLLQLCTALAFFFGLALVPLPVATIMGFTSTLILPFVAWPVLGERPQASAVIAVFIGFAGSVVAINGAGSGGESLSLSGSHMLGVGLCLLSALSYALTLTLVRLRAAHEDTVTINLFVSVMPGLYLFSYLGVDGSLVTRLGDVFSRLGIEVCLFAAAAYVTWFLVIHAYRMAEAQFLAPLEYTALIWSAIASALVFAQPARWPIWVGGSVIVFACLYSAIHRQFMNRRQTRMPSSRAPR